MINRIHFIFTVQKPIILAIWRPSCKASIYPRLLTEPARKHFSQEHRRLKLRKKIDPLENPLAMWSEKKKERGVLKLTFYITW